MMKTIRFSLGRVALLWAFLACLSGGRAQAQVANDDCSGAVTLAVSNVCTAPVNGTVAGASQSLAPTAACGVGLTTATDVWYSFTATSTSHLVTLAPRFAAILDVRAGTCAASTSIFCTTIANNNTAAVNVGSLSSGQTYFIRVYPATNTPPSGISSTFALCIGQGAVGPPNDECVGAIPVPVQAPGVCTGQISADNTSATDSPGLPVPTCANYRGRDLWFSVVVPASGGLTVQTVVPAAGNDVGDTGMNMYSGTCGNLTSIGCDDDAAGNFKSLLSFTGRTPGEVLYVRVWSYNNATSGNIALCATVLTPPANDDCAGAISLPVTTSCAVPVTGTVSGATQSLPAAACGNAAIANDVWYSFVANGTSQTVAFSGSFGAVIDVRSGTCAASTSVFCGIALTGQGLVMGGLTSGQTYFLRLYANGIVSPSPASSAFSLCLTAAPVAAVNDDCNAAVAVAVVAGCTTSTNGTVLGASQSLPPTANCGTGVTTAADVWYRFVASAPTQFITLNARFAAVLDVRAGTCASSATVSCAGIFANTATGTVVGGLTTGQTYFIRIYANGPIQPAPANATFTLCVSPAPVPPSNDDCAGAIAVPVTAACAAPVNGTVEAASQSLPPTAGCGLANILTQDVWYSFLAAGTTQPQ